MEDIARRGVAHVPEGRGVIAELTVEDNLRLATLWCMGRRERQEAIEAMFELFPRLSGFRRRHASTLSGGERQMLVIGRALISRPKLLLLDEPSLGLAPTRDRASSWRSFGITPEGTDMTVVLVEQNARSALSVSQDAVVLNLGEVVVERRGRGDRRRQRPPTPLSRVLGDRHEPLRQHHTQRDRQRDDLRRVGPGAGADLPGHADRQLRPGGHGHDHDVHRLEPPRTEASGTGGRSWRSW